MPLPQGDFDALLAVLDPDIMLRADQAAAQTGAPVIDGRAGLTWAPGGEPRVVFTFTFAIADGRITRIELLADPEHLAQTELELL